MVNTRRRGRDLEADLPNLENFLENNLQPVRPRREFVQDLEERLLTRPETIVMPSENSVLWELLMIVAGVLTGAVIFAIFVRYLVVLLETMKLMKRDATSVESVFP